MGVETRGVVFSLTCKTFLSTPHPVLGSVKDTSTFFGIIGITNSTTITSKNGKYFVSFTDIYEE